jgi:hypothetical protein
VLRSIKTVLYSEKGQKMFPVIFGNPLLICRWVSPGTSASSTNKSYRRNITEILLKVVLKTITLDLINIKLNGRK